MIVLTGDLHHQALGTANQAWCPLSELEVARRYLDLLAEVDVKVTFFVSGRCFDDQWDELAPIAEHPLVELGGHNYDCFTPTWLHRVTNKLVGSYPGTPSMIRRDVRRTRAAAARRTGQRLRVWRNHMYMHGPFMDRVLAEEGIELVSDGVKARAFGPTRSASGLASFPINVIPDHEHLIHAERDPESIARWVRRYGWSDDFGSESYDIETWVDLAIAQIRANEARGAISNVLVHPITMYLADGFVGLERLLGEIARHETAWMTQTLQPHLGSAASGVPLHIPSTAPTETWPSAVEAVR